MQPAQRLAGLQESIIREMTRLAHKYDAINLSQGFPDFPAPEVVKQTAIDAIRSDQNQYSITWGRLTIRQAIADNPCRLYGMDWVGPDEPFTVTRGVTAAAVVANMATATPGD